MHAPPPRLPQGTLTVEAALLIGADGGQSDVRQALLGDGPPDFLGEARCWTRGCGESVRMSG